MAGICTVYIWDYQGEYVLKEFLIVQLTHNIQILYVLLEKFYKMIYSQIAACSTKIKMFLKFKFNNEFKRLSYGLFTLKPYEQLNTLLGK